MAKRKQKHEEHINHEAWAIPYADLLVLLLAFFVVMYSISSVNEAKYRVLSSSLQAAFRGVPVSPQPVQVEEPTLSTGDSMIELPSIRNQIQLNTELDRQVKMRDRGVESDRGHEREAMRDGLAQIGERMRAAMAQLIDEDLVEVRDYEFYIELEIKTDVLFPSGTAEISADKRPILERVAEVLAPHPNPIQVEGHTDNVPIETEVFPSNWELSAARAASVVHLLRDEDIDPMRLAVVGLGEYRPVDTNETAEGRNRNRRVVLTILADPGLQQRWFVEDGGETASLQLEDPESLAVDDSGEP